MSVRPLPSYLKVVPPPGKRFRRPRKPTAPVPLDRQGKSVAHIIRQTEFVNEIADKLADLARTNDPIVMKAVVDRLCIEARCAACMAANLRDFTTCA